MPPCADRQLTRITDFGVTSGSPSSPSPDNSRRSGKRILGQRSCPRIQVPLAMRGEAEVGRGGRGRGVRQLRTKRPTEPNVNNPGKEGTCSRRSDPATEARIRPTPDLLIVALQRRAIALRNSFELFSCRADRLAFRGGRPLLPSFAATWTISTKPPA